MQDEIEESLQRYFPDIWTQQEITVFFGKSRFDRDVVALDAVLNQPIRDLLFRGGKRMRPKLFLALLQSFGKDPKEYLDFAVLVELVHNGTLVIDDIEDNSEMRRGKQALHKMFGIDVAANVGIAMHLMPLGSLAKDNPAITDAMRIRLYEVYSEEVNNVYAGQSLDIYWHKHIPASVTPEQYLEMARLKTGGLIRMAVRFACVLTEQSEKVEKALMDFAESAGIAFQIRDDVLDLTADQEVFGKSFGNDIAEGKMSLPVVLAFQQLSEEQRRQLREILLQHSREVEVVTEAQSLIASTSGVEDAMQQAQELVTSAWEAADPYIPEGEARAMLQELVTSLIKRDH